MLQREGEGNGDGFLIFVWRQWLCDGDNGRYLDCFVNLMGPKIWIGSGLFLDLYVPLPRLQLQNFFFYFGESFKYYIWEWDTSLFLPFFWELWFFGFCYAHSSILTWSNCSTWVYEIFFSFSVLCAFFFFF